VQIAAIGKSLAVSVEGIVGSSEKAESSYLPDGAGGTMLFRESAVVGGQIRPSRTEALGTASDSSLPDDNEEVPPLE
jgi:hypothetical protein